MAEGCASLWKHYQALITFAQHSSLHRLFRMEGTVQRFTNGLSTFCLLFIVYLPDFYEFTLLHFFLLKHASLHRLFRTGESDYL